ncbi:hypothetical protein ACSSS7_007673 [Eimeria intestinalis]
MPPLIFSMKKAGAKTWDPEEAEDEERHRPSLWGAAPAGAPGRGSAGAVRNSRFSRVAYAGTAPLGGRTEPTPRVTTRRAALRSARATRHPARTRRFIDATPPASLNRSRSSRTPSAMRGRALLTAAEDAPWTPKDGTIRGVTNNDLRILGRVSLEVRLGPLKATAPFFVVPGVSFSALLGVDFLCEHEVGVSLAQHALIIEGHSNKLYPFIGQRPRLVPACTVAQDVLLPLHPTTWIRAALPCVATPSGSPTVFAVHFLTADWDPLGLSVPTQVSAGLVEVTSPADTPLHLTAGWPLAKREEQVDGGFVPLLPSPDSCLQPEALMQLRQLVYACHDRFNDGSAPLTATNLLTALLDTGNAAPISPPPRRRSPAMRQVFLQDRACPRRPSEDQLCHPRLPTTLRRLPFDFAYSPAIFQRMVDILLGDMKRVSAVGFIDDIIVNSNTWADHCAHLRQVLTVLAVPQRVSILLLVPHSLLSRRRSSKPPPVRATSTAPQKPKPLGSVSVTLFVPNPLAHPDYEWPFYLDCDGSGDGHGGVLLQPYEKGERVIAYASGSLHGTKKKWTATELEAAALIWALETFRHYIDTAEVCIRTDHAPSEHIRNNSSQCRRLERWALRLQEFRFKVQHRSGAQPHVDSLS